MAANADELLSLAKSRTPADRERLLLAIVELCDGGAGSQDLASSQAAQALLNSIFMNLVVEAEHDIRRRLAEKLAGADWAPSALINVLALDDIEIARPIIATSPLLQDHDLIRLLVQATIEHQIEVARRPNIGPPVVAAILQGNEPAVLTALAGNVTARVNEHDLGRLVAASERIVALRSPLARHPGLTEALARELYQWVSRSIRLSLTARFRLDQSPFDVALGDATEEALQGADSDGPAARAGEQKAMEQQLIAKLDIAGQLRPGYLLRSLREHKLSLFVGGLATLGRFEPDQVRRAVDADQPELLALACAAVGIDRSVFPTILDLVRDQNAGRPGGGQEGARRAIGAFGPFAPDVAATAFRQALEAG